jgi:putative toxin-antitoxin system antitoxin component (TIGR02293 family)
MGLPETKVSDPQSVRIARLMGLADADAMSETVLAKVIGRGVPVTAGQPNSPSERFAVGSLISRMASNSRLTTDLADASPKVNKATDRKIPSFAGGDEQWSGKLSRQESERLYEVSRVYDTALRAFGGNAEKADAFLRRAHPLLDGEVPLELAQVSSAGADAVVNLIGRAVAGVAI